MRTSLFFILLLCTTFHASAEEGSEILLFGDAVIIGTDLEADEDVRFHYTLDSFGPFPYFHLKGVQRYEAIGATREVQSKLSKIEPVNSHINPSFKGYNFFKLCDGSALINHEIERVIISDLSSCKTVSKDEALELIENRRVLSDKSAGNSLLPEDYFFQFQY